MRVAVNAIKRRVPRRAIDIAKATASKAITSDLDRLARLFGTDKSSRYHGYTAHYQQHLHDRRRDVRTILEIGIGGYAHARGGESLKMWQAYFPKATIVGLDIDEKFVPGARIAVRKGDQADPQLLLDLVEEYGQFDIVIDDGSHVSEHVLASFDVLFPAVAPRGLYVIEDLHAAYLPDFAGGPPGTPDTSVSMLKELVDVLCVGRYRRAAQAEKLPLIPVASVHVYPNIVFIERGSESFENVGPHLFVASKSSLRCALCGEVHAGSRRSYGGPAHISRPTAGSVHGGQRQPEPERLQEDPTT